MATVILRPNGAGASTQWTPNGAAANWQCVGSNDGDTTYVSSATSGHTDLYTIDASTLPANAIISSIAITVRMRREAVTSVTHSTRFRVGGTTYLSSNGIVTGGTTSYNTYSPPLQGTNATINPATGTAWTASAISGMQIGYNRAAGSTTMRLTEIYVTVTYTVPAYANKIFFIG